MKLLFLTIPILITLTFISCSLRNDEENFREFINEHVKTIEPKLKALNLANWNASATGEKKYYDEQAN
ncbi:MAG: hypothetical protein N2690_13170, partial [Rhodocyclaceae bacterium]|nr:hypothetical protein [Rhodocyclaceae bacterium]